MAVNEVLKSVSLKEDAKVSRTGYAYREVPGFDGGQLDVIEQLHAHLAQIEDLHARLRFVMTEVRGLLPKG